MKPDIKKWIEILAVACKGLLKFIMKDWHIIPVFLLYPLWGLAQQFMTAGLIAGNLASAQEGT